MATRTSSPQIRPRYPFTESSSINTVEETSTTTNASVELAESFSPIDGYEDEPLLPLLDAISPLVEKLPHIESMAKDLLKKCKTRAEELSEDEMTIEGLTIDESAAIRLYTAEPKDTQKKIYSELNTALREENSENLKPWHKYLRLVIHALHKLPSQKKKLKRGVRLNFQKDYEVGKTFTWWPFTSCTQTVETLKTPVFFGKHDDRTLFFVDCSSGKDIVKHSDIPIESEVLLMPGTQFKVTGNLEQSGGLTIIEIEEIPNKSRIAALCSKHPTDTLEYWCKLDKKLVCNTCILNDHENHECMSKVKAFQAKQNELKTMCQRNKSILRKRHTILSEHDSTISTQRRTISKIFQDLHSLIDQHEKRVLEQMDNVETSALAHRRTFEDQLNESERQINDQLKRVDRLVPWTNAQETMNHYTEIEKEVSDTHLRALNQNMPIMQKFSLDKIEQLVGSVGYTLQSAQLLPLIDIPDIPAHASWSKTSIKIMDKLDNPDGIAINLENGTIFVADSGDHCIKAWSPQDKQVRIVAGVKDSPGSRFDQLNEPTDVIYDKLTNSIIVYDCENQRIVRWSLNPDTHTQGDVILNNIGVSRIAIDCNGAIYVSDRHNHEVRRYIDRNSTGVRIAGSGVQGKSTRDLNQPSFIVIDNKGTLYVSDSENRRILKCPFGAEEGQLICGTSQGKNSMTDQKIYPNGIAIDQNGAVYIADSDRCSIRRWRPGHGIDEVIKFNNDGSSKNIANVFPIDLTFDSHNNMYVVDQNNKCVLRFDFEPESEWFD